MSKQLEASMSMMAPLCFVRSWSDRWSFLRGDILAYCVCCLPHHCRFGSLACCSAMDNVLLEISIRLRRLSLASKEYIAHILMIFGMLSLSLDRKRICAFLHLRSRFLSLNASFSLAACIVK